MNNQSEKCLLVQNMLDSFSEKLVDSRIKLRQKEGSQPPRLEDEAQEHLALCEDCLNYKIANAALMETASALPMLPYDESLTLSIMKDLAQDFQLQSTVENLPAPATRQDKSIVLLLLSFAVFALLLPLEAGDSPWSILSWSLALSLVILLKPLLKKHAENENLPYARV
ncbi:MAG: hypothetical protein SFV17_01650 [Candidatus Obscuribacter sp.]|nr:hypothetical protein [Candidatus Melainabacteria bacterium]MDX1985367.1 hypothetical protein [Candidatus Obscuribacter sp.]